MQNAEEQRPRQRSIRARQRSMDDDGDTTTSPGTAAAAAASGTGGEVAAHSSAPTTTTTNGDDSTPQPPAAPTPTSSMFLTRVRRTDTYQELGHLLQDVLSSPTKALLVFVPAAVVVGLLQGPALAVFVLNFVALVPLGGFILYSTLVFTEDFALLGGLFRAVFGNITELLLGVFALFHHKTQLAQGLMIGSVLTYCLFVLGGSFLVASYGKKKEPFSRTRTSIMSSLVLSGSICLAIPTVISLAVEERRPRHGSHRDKGDEVNNDTLFLSRATSIIQMILFLAYLTFRFHTHHNIFPQNPNAPHLRHADSNSSRGSWVSLRTGANSLQLAILTVLAVCCSAGCANYLIGSLAGAAKNLGISESFAALVVLPQAGSLLKAVTIIRHTRSDASALPDRMSRLDFAIRSIMTNVFDTELFILPMLVMLGWATGVPMKLSFGLFEAVVFLMAIMTMTYLVQHGKTTYFEGIMLMGTYLSMAIALYVRPDVTKTTLSTTLATLGISV